MKFDIQSIPSTTVLPFNSKYMEAKVLEDYKLLNLITEKHNEGYLTESEALTMIQLVRMNESEKINVLLESCVDIDDTFFETITPEMNFFEGERILPFKAIVHANESGSLYKEYTTDRNWDNNTIVGRQASVVANEKDRNLKSYIESSGKEGFDNETRDIYKTFPDTIPSSGEVYESLVTSKMVSGVLNPTSAVILRKFIESCFDEFCVANMQPDESNLCEPMLQKDLPREDETVSPNSDTEDMVASTDADIMTKDKNQIVKLSYDDDMEHENTNMESVRYLIDDSIRFNGIHAMLEGVVYKNNPVFDSEVKKLFGALKKNLQLSNPEDEISSLKECINEERNRYMFNFSSDSTITADDVTAKIIGCGFTAKKNNGKVLCYEKTAKGLYMKINFTTIGGGLSIQYENTSSVKESAIDSKLKFADECESSDVKDAAKRVRKLMDSKDDDAKENLKEAINNLDHAIDNYKDVRKEQKDEIKKIVKDVKESASTVPLYVFLIENTNRNLFQEISNTMLEVVTYDNMSNAKGYMYTPQIICDILDSSPTKKVKESTLDMLEAGYTESEDFKDKLKVFKESLQEQMDEEYACETVLNDVDFMMESLFNKKKNSLEKFPCDKKYDGVLENFLKDILRNIPNDIIKKYKIEISDSERLMFENCPVDEIISAIRKFNKNVIRKDTNMIIVNYPEAIIRYSVDSDDGGNSAEILYPKMEESIYTVDELIAFLKMLRTSEVFKLECYKNAIVLPNFGRKMDDVISKAFSTNVKIDYSSYKITIRFSEESFEESGKADPSEIDGDIKPIIELLNRLGYKVKYSCSGHSKTRIKEDGFNDGVYHGKLYTTARLTFDKNYTFDSLPEGWYQNKNADVTSIYVRAFNYDKKDGTPNEAFELWKKSYMESLKKWAENLKEAKETDEDAKTEAAIEALESVFLNNTEESVVMEDAEENMEEYLDNSSFDDSLANLEKEMF